MTHFSDKQWERVRGNYRKWWKGELGRPILPYAIGNKKSGRPEPAIPSPAFSNCLDLSISPEQIVDRMDHDLSCLEFLGDSFPWVNMAHFGPGVLAAFLGALPESRPDTVWFRPSKRIPVSELHFSYDTDNIWLNRVKEIYHAGMRKWGGSVCMAMTDLGGTLDVLASFLTTEDLLLSLVDQPDEVKRLVQEIAGIWKRVYDEIIEIIKSQQGFSDWSSIFSEEPSYILQCDFSFMISPEMFNEFVKDDLSQMASKLAKPFYHLDGIGELPHLESLLSMDAIKGIQWVPGAGNALKQNWHELYTRISRAGKKILGDFDIDPSLDNVVKILERPDDLVNIQRVYPSIKRQEILNTLSKYGVT